MQLVPPVGYYFADVRDIESVGKAAIPLKICARQLEHRIGRPEAYFLQVDERAGQLNQPFVKEPIRLISLRQPKLFEHVVRFEVQPLVETFKKGEILRLELATAKLVDYRRDRRVIFAHRLTLESDCQIPKCNVLDRGCVPHAGPAGESYFQNAALESGTPLACQPPAAHLRYS